MLQTDEEQITQLFEDGDRALISVDIAELSRIYADDYLQYDESGAVRTKQDLIRMLTSGEIRFITMTSKGREIRLFGDFAIVHGSERDEMEQSGAPAVVCYQYLDVVVRRNGRWQIVASQLTQIGKDQAD